MSTIRIFGITIHATNGLYSLKDLFKASGGLKANQPSNWFRTNEFKKEKEFLESVITVPHKRVTEQNQQVMNVIQGGSPELQGTYVCKDLVYSYAMWVSADFKFAVIRAFDHLANDRILEAQQQVAIAVNTEIKRREPNDKGTLAYIVGCSTYQSQYYYDVLVGKGLLTKHTSPCGQSKYFAVGSVDWFEGYKRSTMLFNSKILAHLPEQIELL